LYLNAFDPPAVSLITRVYSKRLAIPVSPLMMMMMMMMLMLTWNTGVSWTPHTHTHTHTVELTSQYEHWM